MVNIILEGGYVKKSFILILIICLFYVFISDKMVDSLKIPDDAIRIRVIPNSNLEYDQMIKGKVRDALEVTMYDLLCDAESSGEAYEIIKNNLSLVDKDVANILKDTDYGYDVNLGLNYFPEKEYKGVKYAEGYYNSLLVTLGKGEGDNWWCVLFPPLCLIEGDSSEVEYKSLIKEILEKYL